MRVVNPVALTTAMLTASNVPETDYAEWAGGTSYANGANVIKAATHRIYESIVAANAGHDPATDDGTHWIDVGPTNRWAMLDQAVGSLTTGTGEITLTLAPGAVGALAVIDTNAETVQVVMTVDGVTQYDETKSTEAGGGAIDDWYEYFTADPGKVMALTFLDLPLYASGSIAITITGPDPDGPVTVGTLLVGNIVDLGSTEQNPSIGILDYSRKETDDYGVTTVVERAWAKRMTARSLIPTSAVDATQRKLAGLRAKPALWIGEEGYDSLTIYGFFKEFSIDLTLPNISYCSLTIEGLI